MRINKNARESASRVPNVYHRGIEGKQNKTLKLSPHQVFSGASGFDDCIDYDDSYRAQRYTFQLHTYRKATELKKKAKQIGTQREYTIFLD